MQPSAEEQRKRHRIERQFSGDLRRLQSASGKLGLPLFEALVVVRKRDAMRAIAHPVHDPKNRAVQRHLV